VGWKKGCFYLFETGKIIAGFSRKRDDSTENGELLIINR
jgi:hypothetical protein